MLVGMRPPTTRLILGLAVSGSIWAALATVGCRPAEAPPARVPEPAPAPPPLASTEAAGLVAAPEDLPTLRVAGDRLALGDATIALDGFAVPPDATRGLLITPLFDALTALYDERRGPRPDGPPRTADEAGRLALSIAPDAPYGLVSRVLYTAGQARFGGLLAPVDTPDGPRAVPLVLPRLAVAAADDEPRDAQMCSSAATTAHRVGLRVIARRSPPGDGAMLIAAPATAALLGGRPTATLDALLGPEGRGGPGVAPGGAGERQGRGLVRSITGPRTPTPALDALFADPPAPAAPPTPPPWWDALMIPRPGVCPSVPPREGRVDRAAFAALLSAIYVIEPGCTRATVGADPDVRWQDLVDALQVHRSLRHAPVLTIADADTDPLDCAGARVPPGPTAAP